jgi:hypothetical protein
MGSKSVRKDKTRRSAAAPSAAFKSFVSVYAATLAKRVAAELNPRRARPASRKKKPPS